MTEETKGPKPAKVKPVTPPPSPTKTPPPSHILFVSPHAPSTFPSPEAYDAHVSSLGEQGLGVVSLPKLPAGPINSLAAPGPELSAVGAAWGAVNGRLDSLEKMFREFETKQERDRVNDRWERHFEAKLAFRAQRHIINHSVLEHLADSLWPTGSRPVPRTDAGSAEKLKNKVRDQYISAPTMSETLASDCSLENLELFLRNIDAAARHDLCHLVRTPVSLFSMVFALEDADYVTGNQDPHSTIQLHFYLGSLSKQVIASHMDTIRSNADFPPITDRQMERFAAYLT